MNRSSVAFLAFALTAVAAGIGCADAPDDVESESAAVETAPAPADAVRVTDADAGDDLAALTERVQTLFTSRCAGCHTANSAGGFNVVDFATKSVNVASSQVPALKRIAPKDRAKSYVLHKLKGTQATVGGSGGPMPPNGSLTPADIELVGSFIDAL